MSNLFIFILTIGGTIGAVCAGVCAFGSEQISHNVLLNPIKYYWHNLNKKFNKAGCVITTILLVLAGFPGIVCIYSIYIIVETWMHVFRKRS